MGSKGGLVSVLLAGCCCCAWASDEPRDNETAGLSLVSNGLLSVRKPGFHLAAPMLDAASYRANRRAEWEARSGPVVPHLALQPRSRRTIIDLFGWEEDDRVTLATYRSGGPVYFKGRAGYLHLDGEPEYLSDLSVGDFVDNFGASGAFGVGAGYELSNGERLEFEYTRNKADQQVFSVGYTF